uniref:NIDO domain-containing protein n=1 Tax=Panagrolaimus davidi TaxID=227884 RepID=A0A914QUX2_9BILA
MNVAQPQLWVNENGILSFYEKISEFTPWCSAVPMQYRMIAPFWADVDARNIGDIFYRQTTDTTVLQKAKRDISSVVAGDVDLKWAFIATWKDVTYFIDLNDTAPDTRKLNTFQVILTTDGTNSFVIFYYNKIQWTTGDVSGGTNGLGGTQAVAGYDYGDGKNRLLINGSCSSDILQIVNGTNVMKPGQFVFQTNVQQTSPTPSADCVMGYTGDFCIVPNTIDFIGFINLDITQIQLTTQQSAVCHFYDPNGNMTTVEAKIITLTNVKCLTPFFFTIGRIKMELEIYDNDNTANQTSTGYIYVTQPKEQTLHYQVLANQSVLFTWDPTLWNIANGIYSTAKIVFETVCAIGVTAAAGEEEEAAMAVAAGSLATGAFLAKELGNSAFASLVCTIHLNEYGCSAVWKLTMDGISEIATGRAPYNTDAESCAGYPYIQHPSLMLGSGNFGFDKYPWIACCLLKGHTEEQCEGLYKHRHPDPGTNYTAPNASLGNGDPHFTTFDGLYYTFNGGGEFWLLKGNERQPVSVQTRFGLPGGLSSGWTYFKAFAMKSDNSKVVQIEYVSYGSSPTVYYDRIPLPPHVLADVFVVDSVAIWSINSDTIMVSFSEGFSFKVSTVYLTAYASKEYAGNYTRGILGIFDGNPFNDLTTPNGVIVLANSTTEIIHYKFGMEWYITPQDSMFDYFDKNYSSYYFPHFKPSFGYSPAQLPPNADEICDGDPSCLWDLVVTGDESIANQTRSKL